MALQLQASLLLTVVLAATKLSQCSTIRINNDLSIPDERIVGGEVANIEEFPWQVSLEKHGEHLCGGSVISENWVVTAAHCFMFGQRDIVIRAGTTKRSEGGSVHKVDKIIKHIKYSMETFDNDIAVIKVQNPFVLTTKKIKAVQLASEDETTPVGKIATVTGWGRLKQGGSVPKELQKVNVPIISDEECKQEVNVIKIAPRMICAGYKEGGKDACQGDSGGPLVIDGVLYGIVSFGMGCAEPSNPGVYSRVSALRSWIKEHTLV